mgnify:CR=1 FL=1
MTEEKGAAIPAFVATMHGKYFEQVYKIESAKLDTTTTADERFKIVTEAFKEFHIEWGYYLMVDFESGEVTHYPNNDSQNELNKGFKDLPFGASLIEDNLISLQNRLVEKIAEKKYRLNSLSQLPPEFKQFVLNESIDKSGTDVHDILASENFSVVLSTEVLFYIYLRDGLDKNDDIWSYSVEAEKGKEIYVNRLQLLNYLEYFLKRNREIGSLGLLTDVLIKKIAEFKSPNTEEGDPCSLNNIVKKDWSTIKEELEDKRSLLEKLSSGIKYNLDLMIELSASGKSKGKVFDFFVFPMLNMDKDSKEEIYKIHNGEEVIPVLQPMLLCVFIEPIYEITKKDNFSLFEEPDTYEAFRATELLCDYISKPVIDNVYYGHIIRKFRSQELVKSQKAAIMGRNMSHNIGSHVLYYLKKSLSSYDAIFKHDVLESLIIEDGNGNLKLNTGKKKKDLPFLYGLGRFINYLQERQDFIATISTDYIPSMTMINFKDAIFDEINYDLAALRHRAEENYTSHNVVLENIAKSEGYNRSKIQIAYKKDIGLDGPETEVEEIKDWEIISGWEDDRKELRDINIDVPSGTVGRQAFFSVVENILRNACKHGEGKELIRLTIDIFDPFELLEGSVSDEATRKKLFDEVEKIDDYYICSIYDNVDNDISIIKMLQENLTEHLINPNTLSVNQKFKGLKEIKISSAWIIGKTYSDNDLSHIKIDGRASNNGKFNIRYNFLLKKPKEFLYLRKEHPFIDDISLLDTFIPADNYSMIAYEICKEEEFLKLQHETGYEQNYEEYKLKIEEWVKENTNRPVLISESYDLDRSYTALDLDAKKKLQCKSYEAWYEQSNLKAFKLFIDDRTLPGVEHEYKTTENCKFHISRVKAHLESSDLVQQFLSGFQKIENALNTIEEALPVKDGVTIIKKGKFHFAESITGHNSSKTWYRDELIGKIIEGNGLDLKVKLNNLDYSKEHTALKLWSMQTSEAAQLKVGILDERLISDNLYLPSFDSIDNMLEFYKTDVVRFLEENDDQNEKVIKENEFTKTAQQVFGESDNINVHSHRFLITLFETIDNALINPEIKNHKKFIRGLKYRQISDVFTLNIEVGYDFNMMKNVYLYDIDKKARIIRDNHFRYKSQDIGKYSYSTSNKQLTITLERQLDFISIHQGLLDKMVDKEDLKQKSGYYDIKFLLKNEEFKPLITFVHSGRSMPPNLPSNVGFLLFSQLEHCLSDKKKTMIDLFYNTKIL